MKRISSKTSAPDKDLHISKKVAGGATGMALGALVAGPVGAIIGGMAGTMMGSAAQRDSGTTDLAPAKSQTVGKIRSSARIMRSGGKPARVESKIAARGKKKIAGKKARSVAPRAQGKSGRRGSSKRR